MARRRASQRSLSTQPVAAFGLGTWQVQRLRWKEALIEDLSAKLKLPAMRLPPLVKCVVIPVARLTSSVDAIPEFAYRRVLVRGVLDHSREMLLGPHLRHGRLCYSLITPLHRTDTDGSEAHADILVNRGVIDRDLADRAKRPGSLESQPVAIVGMLRSQQRKSMMASDNRPDLGQWIHVDIERMAEHAGTQPVLIDEIYVGNAGEIRSRLDNGLPIGRDATIELRNQHASYVATWYGLSALSAVSLWRLLKRRAR